MAVVRIMSERHEVFDVKELQIISYKCRKCENVILFDLQTERIFGLPKECPTCGESLDGVAQLLADYHAFYQSAAKLRIRLQTKPVISRRKHSNS
jgi:predicted RNA-binding Zn-ribbon protein involved in translation (DUF1610 family)